MIYNRFYHYLAFILVAFIFSSCLNSDDVEFIPSADAQVTSIKLSSLQDTLNILPKVTFSIDQVSSAPLIFNKDSLPYLFEVSKVEMVVNTNAASGIKLHLANPDSTYIWNKTDSVSIDKLEVIEVFAQNGKTSRKYTFQLNIHQQDPDTIFWQKVTDGYISNPVDQVTLSDSQLFYTYYRSNNSLRLSTTDMSDGSNWTSKTLSGLSSNIVLSSIIYESNNKKWYALNNEHKAFQSTDGVNWNSVISEFDVASILGTIPSNEGDAILTAVIVENKYKFAKTKDFTSFTVLNEIPTGFPIDNLTSTTISNPNSFTSKYLVVTSGTTVDGKLNKDVWLLQDDNNEIKYTSVKTKFDVTGSSLFNYDKKLYLLVQENNRNVFYTSSNYGAFWTKAGNKQSLPVSFTNRTYQSTIVDDKNFIWIFGGKATSNASQINDVWKGRINKLFVK